MIGSEAARAIGTISQLAAQALFWKNSLRFYVISNEATFPTCLYNLNRHFQSLDHEIRGSKLYEFLFEQPKVHVRGANKPFFFEN